jgi:hypothetical protein
MPNWEFRGRFREIAGAIRRTLTTANLCGGQKMTAAGR